MLQLGIKTIHQKNPLDGQTDWVKEHRLWTIALSKILRLSAFGFPISLNGYENNTVTRVTCSNPKTGLLLSTWKERRKRKEHEKLQAWRHRRSMPSSLETEAVSLDQSKSHVHSLLWSIDRLENRCWMLVAPKTPEGVLDWTQPAPKPRAQLCSSCATRSSQWVQWKPRSARFLRDAWLKRQSPPPNEQLRYSCSLQIHIFIFIYIYIKTYTCIDSIYDIYTYTAREEREREILCDYVTMCIHCFKENLGPFGCSTRTIRGLCRFRHLQIPQRCILWYGIDYILLRRDAVEIRWNQKPPLQKDYVFVHSHKRTKFSWTTDSFQTILSLGWFKGKSRWNQGFQDISSISCFCASDRF